MTDFLHEVVENVLPSRVVVVDSVREVWEFFEEEGIDVEDADEESILEADEVFEIGDGRFLIVEG